MFSRFRFLLREKRCYINGHCCELILVSSASTVRRLMEEINPSSCVNNQGEMAEEANVDVKASTKKDIRNYLCQYCGISRSKKYLITSHIQSHHQVWDLIPIRFQYLSFVVRFQCNWELRVCRIGDGFVELGVVWFVCLDGTWRGKNWWSLWGWGRDFK